jgi:hypothetical protein
MIKGYEEKYVLFVDILGFKNLIDKTLINRNLYEIIYEILTRAYISGPSWTINERTKLYEPNTEYTVSKPLVYSFSDTIIITGFINKDSLINIFYLINQLLGHFLDLGIFWRGGFLKGLIRDDMQVAFGPAIIEAYFIENKIAKFPRLIIDNSIVNEIQNIKKNTYETIPFPFIYPRIKLDNDGYYFYDILNILPNWIIKDNNCWRNPNWEEWMNRLRYSIIKNINENKKNIKKKYIWFAKYFNNTLISRGEKNIKKIKLSLFSKSI